MNILYVNACPREGSRTAELARHLLSHLEGDVQELALYEENILPLNPKTLALRDKLKEAGNYDHPMFKYARQFAAAGHGQLNKRQITRRLCLHFRRHGHPAFRGRGRFCDVLVPVRPVLERLLLNN